MNKNQASHVDTYPMSSMIYIYIFKTLDVVSCNYRITIKTLDRSQSGLTLRQAYRIHYSQTNLIIDIPQTINWYLQDDSACIDVTTRMEVKKIPLGSASVFLIVHHSTRFRVDLLVPSEVNVCLLTVCNFCHNVSKTHRQTYPVTE
jgi:hypothetical protein